MERQHMFILAKHKNIYLSTTTALNSITPEITRESGLIKKSVTSHEDKVELYKESHLL